MQHKNEMKDKLQQFLAYVKTQTVKTVMSDNGGVYRDQDFIDCLQKNRIQIGRLAAYTPT